MNVTARTVALRVLTAQEKGGWSDKLLKRELRQSCLSGADVALCTRLCYGVLQNRMLLDYYLAPHSHMPLRRLEARVLNVLRLGTYQIVMMDRVPDYAGVSECVALTKTVSGSKTAGYVNAVLRSLLREPTHRQPEGPACARLSVLYSQPQWQVDAYVKRLGEAEAEALLRANNEPAPLWVHVNALRTEPEALISALARDGVQAEPHSALPGCFSLSGHRDIEQLEAYQKGLFLVADPAARLAVMAANPRPGMRVIDGCAAPGGKSFFCAMAMDNTGHILSCDIHPHKITLLERGRDRMGFSVVTPCLKDAGVFDEALSVSADLVIADVPCSGLGIVRKKPDIRYKEVDDLEALPGLQQKLLENLANYVKPGGQLLYITCTLRPEENEAVCDAFAATNPAFLPEPFVLPAPYPQAMDGRLTLWPHRHDTDGFFVALFRRQL